MTTNQQQIGVLLKALIAKGVETKDAVPTLKRLIEAKIFDIQDVTNENLPSDIDPKIRKKLLPKTTKKRVGGKSSASSTGSPSKRSKTSNDNDDDGGNIIQPPATPTRPDFILINRSPVLTLWATVVARHVYPKLSLPEALSLASVVTAEMAKAKGTSLGIFQECDKTDAIKSPDGNNTKKGQEDDDEEEIFQLLGVTIQTIKTPSGSIRGLANGGEMQNPNRTWKHLKNKFKDDATLGFVMDEMDKAAKAAGSPAELNASAYQYYVHVRPGIPHGTKGWGAHGRLESNKLSNFYGTKNC